MPISELDESTIEDELRVDVRFEREKFDDLRLKNSDVQAYYTKTYECVSIMTTLCTGCKA